MAHKLFVWRIDLTRSYGLDTIAVSAPAVDEAREIALNAVNDYMKDRYDWMEPEDFLVLKTGVDGQIHKPEPAVMPFNWLFVKGSD